MYEKPVGDVSRSTSPRVEIERGLICVSMPDNEVAQEEEKVTPEPVDPRVAHLVPIAHRVIRVLRSLRLETPNAQRAHDKASCIIILRTPHRRIRAAEKLAVVLNRGNAQSRALAAMIRDILQCDLPFITRPVPVPPDAFAASMKEIGLEIGNASSTGTQKQEDRGRA